MKIVSIFGGLGNQMFQYAFLIALRESFHEDIKIDTSAFKYKEMHNGFELNRLFDIDAKEVTIDEKKRLTTCLPSYYLNRIYWKYFPRRKTEMQEDKFCSFNKDILTNNSDLYYYGIWQNHMYFDKFENVVKKIFTFKLPLDEKNQEIKEKLSNENFVSLHIRRGDYLKHSNYKNLCGKKYYKKAIEYLRSKYHQELKFAIFSNDMEWCGQNIIPLIENNEYICVDWNKKENSYIDMELMSCCRVNIIANSSFSWWAAYLNNNKDKEVIAPDVWTNANVKFNRQLPYWTLIDSKE